jgi:hypothetical protein
MGTGDGTAAYWVISMIIICYHICSVAICLLHFRFYYISCLFPLLNHVFYYFGGVGRFFFAFAVYVDRPGERGKRAQEKA